MAAEACPDRTAITFEGEHYDYQTLFEAASRAAQTSVKVGAALSLCLIPQARLRQLR